MPPSRLRVRGTREELLVEWKGSPSPLTRSPSPLSVHPYLTQPLPPSHPHSPSFPSAVSCHALFQAGKYFDRIILLPFENTAIRGVSHTLH